MWAASDAFLILHQNWFSNLVFDVYEAILTAASDLEPALCPARNNQINRYHKMDGKWSNPRARRIICCTLGCTARIQDWDKWAVDFTDNIDSFPTKAKFIAESGYAGDELEYSMLNTEPGTIIEIVLRQNQVTGFVVIARRGVVKRNSTRLSRCRRLAMDWENHRLIRGLAAPGRNP